MVQGKKQLNSKPKFAEVVIDDNEAKEMRESAKLQYYFEICNTALSGYLLFIYALHPFLLFHVIALINKVAPMGEAWYMQTFCYLTAPLACVMVCEGVYWGMRMYMPSVMRVLIGREMM